MDRPRFEVTGLRIGFSSPSRSGEPPVAVPGSSFGIADGEVLALVGESGSGKSLTALGAFGLVPPGAILLGGRARLGDLEVALDRLGRRRRRRAEPSTKRWWERVGREVGFLFQDPVAAWTPTLELGDQAGEVLEVHEGLPRDEIERRLDAALGEVRLPRGGGFRRRFSSELSRGEAQRAMLAAALVKGPRLLVADEPLSGLDPPVAAAILDLIVDLRRERGLAMLLVTHDLGVVARLADRVAVVYHGRIVEEGPVREVYHRPRHPYTAGLLASIPGRGRTLRPIVGEAPILGTSPSGCAFAPRCPYAASDCRRRVPALEPIGGSRAACHRKFVLELPGV